MPISSAIFFVSACLSLLVILQLDITFYTMLLKKQQIFFHYNSRCLQLLLSALL